MDFTKLSNKEILGQISKAGGCGRFTQNQLYSTFEQIPEFRIKFTRLLFSSFLLTPFFSHDLYSKNIEKAKTNIAVKFIKEHFLVKNLKIDSLNLTCKVVDNLKNEIPGVSIFVKGTSHHFFTNKIGSFSIPNYIAKILDKNSILIFSSIGFKSIEIKLTELAQVVILEEDSKALDDINIVGGYCSNHRSLFQRMIHKLKTGL